MKIYKNKLFHQWTKKEALCDTTLLEIIDEMEKGIFDANLGGYIYKKRIAIRGKGKSSSLRTIIAYKTKDTAIFIYGYAKNAKENVTVQEELALKKLAKLYFSLSNDEINIAVNKRELVEVHDEKKHFRDHT